MKNEKVYSSLKEFYPFYLSQHRNNFNRILHYTGTLLSIIFLITSYINLSIFYFSIVPLIGYGFAWIGHFFFEQNKPATFKYPFYSLISDYIMLYHFFTGKIKCKFEEYKLENIKCINSDLF